MEVKDSPEKAAFEHKLIDSFVKKYNDLPLTSFLAKTYFVLLLQFLIILLFTWYGFDTGISDKFINGRAPNVVFFVTTLAITGLTFGALPIFRCQHNNQFVYIYFFVYCLIIIFYVNVLTKFAEKIYIIFALVMIVLDLIALELYIILFNYYCLSGIAISQVIMSIISTPIFSYFIVWRMPIITRLIVINLSVIMYFELITFVAIYSIDNKSVHFSAVLLFDFAIFVPVAIVVALAIVLTLIALGLANMGSSEI